MKEEYIVIALLDGQEVYRGHTDLVGEIASLGDEAEFRITQLLRNYWLSHV